VANTGKPFSRPGPITSSTTRFSAVERATRAT
jgi:hypothetical protein